MTDSHETRVLAGYKATLSFVLYPSDHFNFVCADPHFSNPNVSPEAKAHAEKVLADAGIDIYGIGLADGKSEHEHRVLGGYKSTLSFVYFALGPEAKAHAEQVLVGNEASATGATTADDEHENRVLGGYKATLSNPNAGHKAKEHAKEVLNTASGAHSEHDKHVLAGYKGVLAKDNTSEEAKEKARIILSEAGELCSGFRPPAMDDEDNSSGWQLTESDPGVTGLSELLKSLGIPLVVDDLYSLDSESLAALQPIRALIFLFKWIGGGDEAGGGEGKYDEDFPGFFAHQVVNNACATIAVLNGVCNIPSLKMGPELTDLISFTAGMDSQTTGLAVTSSDFLRSAHNALSPPSVLSISDGPQPQSSEDAYHFISYLPVVGQIYEFDGLKRAPVAHGTYNENGEGWVAKAREVIEKRIGTYPLGSLHFNLLAVRDDPIPSLHEQLTAAQAAGQELAAAELMSRLTQEQEKRARWNFENALRRHNHLGLIHALLVQLAKKGQLDTAVTAAKAKMQERLAKARATGQMEED
ncbi:Ubiquitin carboxyl-terminal hydrolase [Ceratobasidium theobromae]|uniref:Ubiquitin carboxyl-terminal hydrolase n=1 Tax=Ceratobasidium theobromae TaxID=1582974 RepID=A0A5N5QWT3_9AGAM|nr:Ubiquitin carboxyl-terminal hydrolase [Ceratobasidium theobromae]